MIKISTRFRYGLRALLALAKAYPDQLVSVNQIARTQQISPKYLEQIMAQLKSGNIVKSHPGINGGYRLLHPPSKINLLDVANILEGELAVTECAKATNICQNEDLCPARKLWQNLNHAIEGVLTATTLDQLSSADIPLETEAKSTQSAPSSD